MPFRESRSLPVKFRLLRQPFEHQKTVAKYCAIVSYVMQFGIMDVIEKRISSIANEAEDALMSKEIEEIRRYEMLFCSLANKLLKTSRHPVLTYRFTIVSELNVSPGILCQIS